MTTQSRDPYSKDPRIAMIIRVKGLKYIDFFKVTTTAGDHGTIDETRNVKWAEAAPSTLPRTTVTVSAPSRWTVRL